MARRVWPAGWPGGSGPIFAHHVPILPAGPYQHGSGFPSVNGDSSGNVDPIPSLIPPSFVNVDTPQGPHNLGQFTSEFGMSVWQASVLACTTRPVHTFTDFRRPTLIGALPLAPLQSFESMAGTVAPQHWGIQGGAPPDKCTGGGWPSTCTGGNVMAQRNYPAWSWIYVYFGDKAVDKNATGEAAFRAQVRPPSTPARGPPTACRPRHRPSQPTAPPRARCDRPSPSSPS